MVKSFCQDVYGDAGKTYDFHFFIFRYIFSTGTAEEATMAGNFVLSSSSSRQLNYYVKACDDENEKSTSLPPTPTFIIMIAIIIIKSFLRK